MYGTLHHKGYLDNSNALLPTRLLFDTTDRLGISDTIGNRTKINPR